METELGSYHSLVSEISMLRIGFIDGTLANHVLSFNTKIKNQPDDCADALTGVYERGERKTVWG